MAGEIIRQGDSTSHGGRVLEGSPADICHGKPIAYIGHKVSCPKCKGIYPIVEGVVTATFYGKGVAVAGMKTACGATLIPTQFTDIVEWSSGASGQAGKGAEQASEAKAGGTGSAAATAAAIAAAPTSVLAKDTLKKEVTRIYWSYGDTEVPLSDKARFYVDLNLHVETKNYSAGETVNVTIQRDDGSDLADGLKTIDIQAKIQDDGKGKVKNVFLGKTIDTTWMT